MAVMLFYFVFSSGADRCPCREAAHRPEQKRPGSIYSIKTVMTEYVSYRLTDAVSWCRTVCVSVCVCLGRPGRDWHEALAAKCNLHPDGERPAADIHPGGAGGSVRPTHTDAGEHTHLLVAELFFFLKLPFGVFCHLFLSQRNWCPVSWLHPHAKSSANQVEPLDSKVTEDDTSNLPTCYTLDDVLFMSVSCFSSTGSSSHAVALSRDVDQLQEIKKRVDVLPLGR